MLTEVSLIFLRMPVLEIFDLDKLDLQGLIRLLTGVLNNFLVGVMIGETIDSIGQQGYYIYLFRHTLILSSNFSCAVPAS